MVRGMEHYKLFLMLNLEYNFPESWYTKNCVVEVDTHIANNIPSCLRCLTLPRNASSKHFPVDRLITNLGVRTDLQAFL